MVIYRLYSFYRRGGATPLRAVRRAFETMFRTL